MKLLKSLTLWYTRKSFSCLDFLIFVNHFDIENAWNEYQVAWMCREIEREV